MTEPQTDLLDRMLEVIVREANPETVILFGSRARQEARPDSDVDLLVVETEPFTPSRSRRKEIHRLIMALRHFPVSKDILLYSRDEFDYWKDSLNNVIGRACRDGKVLHERH
jgi:predicted nucleotidyltransferase